MSGVLQRESSCNFSTAPTISLPPISVPLLPGSNSRRSAESPVTISQMLLALVSAGLLAAPFLDPRLFLFVWCAFLPLFWTVDHAKGWRSAAFYGWIMGTAAHLIGFYWLVYTISAFGEFLFAVRGIVFIIICRFTVYAWHAHS